MMQCNDHYHRLRAFSKNEDPYRPLARQVEVSPGTAGSGSPARLAVISLYAYKRYWRHRMNALDRALRMECSAQRVISADEVLQRKPKGLHACAWRGSVAKDNAQLVPRSWC